MRSRDDTARWGWLAAGGAMLLLLLGVHLSLGSTPISLAEAWRALAGEGGDVTRSILLDLRLPRALNGLLAGAGLAVAGLVLQTFFRNPLAGPSVLGISAGASLGVALVLLTGLGSWGMLSALTGGPLLGSLMAAATGGLASLLLILGIASRVRSPVVLLLIGLMIGYLSLALLSLIQYFAAPDELRSYLVWTFGSLGGLTRAQLPWLALPLLLAALWALRLHKALDLLLLGPDYARSMGLRPGHVRWQLILLAGGLTGLVTAFSGPIAFIGIAVPHLVRGLLSTARHAWLIPGCLLLGADLLLACDLLAKWPGSARSLPLNAVTSLVGAPVVILVILRQYRLQNA